MESKDRLFQIFSKKLRGVLETLNVEPEGIEEIRMRIGAPLFIIYRNKEYTVDEAGRLGGLSGDEEGEGRKGCFCVSREDVEVTLQCAVRYSLYAYEEELRQGFITVSGGHRIGVAGRVIMEKGAVKTIQPVTFLNIRFSHQVKGCADRVLPYLFNRADGDFLHTLLISPPRCGKTTLLRDIVRQVSNGASGKTVGVVDERSEIGACFQGIPQNDVGRRTDILDCCPKAAGMMMLIRSMAPDVVAVDEIGGEQDLEAMRYVMNCGCRILATIHGTSMDDIRKKPGFSRFMEESFFDRYVILGNGNGPGTIREICDGNGRNLLCG